MIGASGLGACIFKSQLCCLLATGLWVNPLLRASVFSSATWKQQQSHVIWCGTDEMENSPPIWRTCYVACHTVTTNHMLTIMPIYYCYYGDDPKSLFWAWPSDPTFQVPILSPPTRALAISSPVRFKLSVSFASDPDLPSVFPLCHPPGFPAANLCDSLNVSLSCEPFAKFYKFIALRNSPGSFLPLALGPCILLKPSLPSCEHLNCISVSLPACCMFSPSVHLIHFYQAFQSWS